VRIVAAERELLSRQRIDRVFELLHEAGRLLAEEVGDMEIGQRLYDAAWLRRRQLLNAALMLDDINNFVSDAVGSV
jgi:hypothetical protein